jgi:hypothetical protein
LLLAFVVLQVRDRDGEDARRGYVDCSAFEALDDPIGSRALFDIFPVRPNVKAGRDNGSDQEDHDRAQPANALPQVFEAPFPARNPVDQLLEKVLLLFSHSFPRSSACHERDALTVIEARHSYHSLPRR